jgi:hypothetical protein
MGSNLKRVLVIYDHRDSLNKMRLSIQQHLHALERNGKIYEVLYYNTFDVAPSMLVDDRPGNPPSWLQNKHFDAVILHNTFLCFRWTGSYFYRWKYYFGWVGKLDCLKIAIPQDEYDHCEILDEWMFDWKISAIFTNFDEELRRLFYPIMHDKAVFYRALTGYIDDGVAKQYKNRIRPIEERITHIVYRARHLPYWFGGLGQMKHQIADIVARRATERGLTCDISTRVEDEILGDRWLDFLASGKCVIGCEGGSSVLDHRGEIRTLIQAMLKKKAEMTFQEVHERMPAGWDGYHFLTVTPRHFEAVITKTCQILIEGRYDDVLIADKHYLPLKRDFSNLDEILGKIEDQHYLRDIVECAYKDIYLSGSYSYQKFSELLEMALQSSAAPPGANCRDMGAEVPEQMAEILERQLVAERHKCALLEAQLLGAKGHSGESQTEFSMLFRGAQIVLRRMPRKWLWIIIGCALALIAITAAVSTFLISLLLNIWGPK